MTQPKSDNEQLGLTTLVMLVVAAMIGFGVFTSSGFALSALGSPGRVILAWLFCGGWAIAGAIAYGGLAKRVPLSGGEYLYLSRLMHPSIGFLAGWISLVAGFTAPIAAAAKAVIVYGLPAVTDETTACLLASLVIGIVCLYHTASVGIGAVTQNVIVLVKLGFVAVLLAWAFLGTASENWVGGPLPDRPATWWPSDFSQWRDFAAAMAWIALSYVGFNAAVYVAGESRAAQRNVPRAMLWATLLVTLIYVLLNIVFVFGPSSLVVTADVPAMQAIAATATRTVGGVAMETLTRLVVALAVLSSVSGMMLAGPRVYAQMARDGVMPQFMHAAGKVPRIAIATQAALSICVVWLAQLDELIRYLSMTLSACSALAVAALWRVPPVAQAASGSSASGSASEVAWYEHLCAAGYIGGTIVMLVAVTLQDLAGDFGRERRMRELIAVGLTFVLGLLFYAAWQFVKGPRPKEVA